LNGKELFYQRTSGPNNYSVDYWYLIRKPDGSIWVEHTWWHHNAEDAAPGVGLAVLSAGHFFASETDEVVLSKLRAAIARAIS